jgi:hypothetical protein
MVALHFLQQCCHLFGVAVDGSGDLFISDEDDNTVRVVDPSTHNINAYAGTSGVAGNGRDGGYATSATLAGPHGLAMGDNKSTYHVTDGISPITPTPAFTHIRQVCALGTPTVTVTSPGTTCSGTAPTFTATTINSCGVNYSWFKSVDGGSHWTMVVSCPCSSITDYSASNGEQIECIVTVSSSYTDYCVTAGDITSNTVTTRCCKSAKLLM